MEGWESQNLFNCDYELIKLSDAEFEFLKACDRNRTAPQPDRKTVQELLANSSLTLAQVRTLFTQHLILFSPG